MQRTHAIQVKSMVLTPPMAATMHNVAGQLAPTSRKTYTIDTKHFAQWLAGQELSLSELHRDDLVAYRALPQQNLPRSVLFPFCSFPHRDATAGIQAG